MKTSAMQPFMDNYFVDNYFTVVFVGLWCAMSFLLSSIGGWRRLAERFAARDEPTGRRFYAQSGKIGFMNYNGCLKIRSAPQGLHLSVMLPFRIGHPPLFIPWQEVRNAKTRRLLWFENVEFDVGSPTIATLRLSKKVFEGQNVAGVSDG